MLDKLIENWKARKAIRRLEQHPIYGAVLGGLRETLNDKTQGIGKLWSEEGKVRLIIDVISDIEFQLAQPNQIQAIRIRSFSTMIEMAKFDVLIMQPPTPFKWLSGDLKKHIPALAKKDKDLEEFFYGINPTPESFDDMWNVVLGRYWVLHLYLLAHNIARVALKDFNDDASKDWFRVCYLSVCVIQENDYRSQLGLPLTINGDRADLKNLALSVWLQIIEGGHKELRLDWERSWEDIFHEPSPFAGLRL